MQTLEWSPKSFEISTFKESEIPEITIKSLNNIPFSIKNINSSNQSFTADFNPDLKATQFTLKLKPDFKNLSTIKTNSGIISIQLDHPDYNAISLSFQLIKSLQVSPTQIVVTRIKHGEPVEKTIEVLDNAAEPNQDFFKQIESITATEGAKVEVLKSNNLKNGCRINLKIQPTEKEIEKAETFVRDEIVIKMKDGNQIKVPVRIYYQ